PRQGSHRGPQLGPPGVEDARRADQCEAVEAARHRRYRLGRDEPAHRVPDQRGAFEAELLAKVVNQATVGRNVDLPTGHWAGPEAGQVERDRAATAAEVGEGLQPVLPAAGDPVDENDWLALADLDVADLGTG